MKRDAETQLSYLIEIEEKQIIEQQKLFWAFWEKQIMKQFELSDGFHIQDHICIFGGFYMTAEEMKSLDASIASFIQLHTFYKNGKYFTRDFDYYAPDPLMYLQDRLPDDSSRWLLLRRNWDSLRKVQLGDYQKYSYFDFADWKALLSLAELAFNCLSSIYWVVNKMDIDNYDVDDVWPYMAEINHSIEQTARCIANLLVMKESFCLKKNIEALNNVIMEQSVETVLEILQKRLQGHQGLVRSIREADSLAQLYGTAIMKLQEWIRHEHNDIVLLGNAFGSVNSGVILKHILATWNYNVQAGNIHYSQNRLDSDVFGGESKHAVMLKPEVKIAEGMTAILVDDCIFTGKTFNTIKEQLASLKVKTSMLPLSVDINSLKYCRLYADNFDQFADDAEKALKTANEINSVPPPFLAFWEWNDKSYQSCKDLPKEYINVLNGGDLLRKELWKRFRTEILKTTD